MLDKCTTISGTCHLQFPCGAPSTARHPHADLSSSFATCHQLLIPDPDRNNKGMLSAIILPSFERKYLQQQTFRSSRFSRMSVTRCNVNCWWQDKH